MVVQRCWSVDFIENGKQMSYASTDFFFCYGSAKKRAEFVISVYYLQDLAKNYAIFLQHVEVVAGGLFVLVYSFAYCSRNFSTLPLPSLAERTLAYTSVARCLHLSFNCWVKPSAAAHHVCVNGSSTRKLAQPPAVTNVEAPQYLVRVLLATLALSNYFTQPLSLPFWTGTWWCTANTTIAGSRSALPCLPGATLSPSQTLAIRTSAKVLCPLLACFHTHTAKPPSSIRAPLVHCKPINKPTKARTRRE